MIEKVNPAHPDKIADRIAGAIVDLAYQKNDNPKVAVEVLIVHGTCHIIIESSETFTKEEVDKIVKRIAGNITVDLVVEKQDEYLAKNQDGKIRCGDNGIFKGVPLSDVEIKLSNIARNIYDNYPYDGKYILDHDKLIICQSNVKDKDIFTIGDIISIGINPPIERQTDLLYTEFYNVTSININDFGDNPHIHLGGK